MITALARMRPDLAAFRAEPAIMGVRAAARAAVGGAQAAGSSSPAAHSPA
jgi:hypothetical protein